MDCCSNLFFLSALACQLAQCLNEEELSVLSSDLVVLSDMLANLIAREAACRETAVLFSSSASL